MSNFSEEIWKLRLNSLETSSKNIINNLRNEVYKRIFASILEDVKNKKQILTYSELFDIFKLNSKKSNVLLVKENLLPKHSLWTKNEQLKIKKDLSKYIKNPYSYLSVIDWIKKYLSSKLKYSFTLAFTQWIDKEFLLNKTILTKENIDFLKKVIYLETSDTIYFKKFKSLLSEWNSKNIKEYLIDNYKKFSKKEQNYIIDIFSGRILYDWNSLYSSIANSSIYDILYNKHMFYCLHLSYMVKKLFNISYKWNNAYMMLIINPKLWHSYNLLLIKWEKWDIWKRIYIDIQRYINSRKWIYKDYWNNDFDILWLNKTTRHYS